MNLYKNIILFFLVFLFVNSFSQTNLIKAKVLYIQPFDSTMILRHSPIDVLHQAAWILNMETNDSLAVLFKYNITYGSDIKECVETGNIYKFQIKKYSIIKEKMQNNNLKTEFVIDGKDTLDISIYDLPDVYSLKKDEYVISNEYWIVNSIEKGPNTD